MKRLILGSLGLVALTSTCYGAGKDVEALLSKMRHAYSSVHTATFRVTTDIKAPTGQVTLISSIQYQAPLKLMIRLSAAGKSIGYKVSDGQNVAEVVTGRKTTTTKATIDTVVTEMPLNLEAISFYDWKRQLSTDPGANMNKSTFKIKTGESWNGKNWTVLEKSASNGDFVRYFIDPSTNLIWRTVFKPKDQTEPAEDFKLSDLKLNPAIPAGAFQLPVSV